MSDPDRGVFDPGAPSRFDGVFGLPTTHEQARVVLLPVPWEPSTSYRRGTAGGPRNVRACSHQVDLYDRDFGRVYEAGLFMLDEDPRVVALNEEACRLSLPIVEAGGVDPTSPLAASLERVNALSRELNERVQELARRELDAGRRVGLVGGDHSSPFGLIAELAARHPGMGILHVDAHADLRVAYEGFTDSHASIMYNVHERLPYVKIVQVGVRDFSEQELELARSSSRILGFFDGDLADRAFHGGTWASVVDDIVSALPELVYVSFDVDGLDPALCPGTGTPVPGGLSFAQATFLIREVAKRRTLVGFDLNEVAGSGVAGEGEWDGIVGARLLYKLAGALARGLSVP
jgi:agmatinase